MKTGIYAATRVNHRHHARAYLCCAWDRMGRLEDTEPVELVAALDRAEQTASDADARLLNEQLRTHSLERLVSSLIDESAQAEARFSRERQRCRSISAPTPAVTVPLLAVVDAQVALVDGSNALMAAQEHTLRLIEMRLASMSAQLEHENRDLCSYEG